MTSLRVGINALFLIPDVVGGTETYARELLCALGRISPSMQFVVFLPEEARDWPLPARGSFERVVCPVRAHARGARYAWEQAMFPSRLKAHRVDVLHSLGYVGPLYCSSPHIVTIHDLNFSEPVVQMGRIRRAALGFFVGQAVRRADHLIAVSEFTRSTILREYRVSPGRVSVIHEGPSVPGDVDAREVAEVRSWYGIDEPYIITFSSTSPHKNLETLINAVTMLENRIPHTLVIVGHLAKGLEASIAYRGGGPRLRQTGYVPSRHVAPLLKGADVFVFPSLHEGFGLPVLDAQRLGVPVACSRAGALPEVAGAGAVLFDPTSPGSIAHAILCCLGGQDCAYLSRKGMENASRYSWSKAAEATHLLYHTIAQTSGSARSGR